MTDITDGMIEDDCRLLRNLLNDVLQRELGPQFMKKLERTSVLAQWVLTTTVAISRLEENQVNAYHENVRQEMLEIVDKYICICE